MNSPSIALLGLGTMGQALGENLLSHGIPFTVWNRSVEKSEAFVRKYPKVAYVKQIKEFIPKLPAPRVFWLMLPSGVNTLVLEELLRVAEPGDILVDGGNIAYPVSQHWEERCEEKGLHFMGLGISGGEEGARKGPSFMAGGSDTAWKALEPILKKVSAIDFSGNPCVAFMGSKGAGHAVKMVHNGIEYAEMQALAEAFEILSVLYTKSPSEIADIFQDFQKGLEAFLFEASIQVLKREEEGQPLVFSILDVAEQKGTGSWTALESLKSAVPTPSLTLAVYARGISSQKTLREKLSKDLNVSETFLSSLPLEEIVKYLKQALELARLLHFEQGFNLLRAMSEQRGCACCWPLAEMARIWQGGCIIRSRILEPIHEHFKKNPKVSLLESEFGKEMVQKNKEGLVHIVQLMTQGGLPSFAFSTALSYLNAMTQARSNAAFIQGLRDYFGSHGYERIDKEGTFHTQWNE